MTNRLIFAACSRQLRLLSVLTFAIIWPASQAAAVTIKIYDGFESNTVDVGLPYSNLVGQYQSPDVNFTNWAPFGRSQFAATIEGDFYATTTAYYSIWINSSFRYTSDVFQLGYIDWPDPYGSFGIGSYSIEYLITEGFHHVAFNVLAYPNNDFTQYGSEFQVSMSPWGGDPRTWDGTAQIYFIPDSGDITGEMVLATIGLLMVLRRYRRNQ